MSDAKKIMDMIKENDITFVDLRFTDPRGKMQHVTQHIDTIDEESFAEGFMFDGSSIAGWKAINESDMTLMPDLYRTYIDPFFAQPTLALCSVTCWNHQRVRPTHATRAAQPKLHCLTCNPWVLATLPILAQRLNFSSLRTSKSMCR